VVGSPTNNRAFSEYDDVVLRWQGSAPLSVKEYYVVQVVYDHLSGQEYVEKLFTKETSWLLSERRYLLDISRDGKFRWFVQVQERTGEFDSNGQPLGVPRSPPSEVRAFEWRRSSGGSGGGQPATPVIPNP
jgi:hypothetical protein